MSEAYAISARLTMRSNVPEVITQMVRGFEQANRLIRETQEGLGRISADIRALSGGGRGVNALVASLQKLSEVKMGSSVLADLKAMVTYTREMQEAQAGLAKSALETAEAYRSMAAASRSGAGSRRPPGAPTAGLHGANDDYANASAENASRVQAYRASQALAERENADRDRIARAAQAAADARYRNERALAERENADRDRAAREESIRQARRYQEERRQAELENRNRDMQARAAARDRSHQHTSALDVGLGLQMGGSAGMDFFERSIRATFEVAHISSQLTQDDRYTPALRDQVMARAEETARLVPGTTVAENVEGIRALTRQLGSTEEALRALPDYSRNRMVLAANDRRHGGGGDNGAAASEAAAKYIEDMALGTDAQGRFSYEKWAAAMTEVTRQVISSQGALTPQMLLATGKQGRGAYMSLSAEGRQNIIPLVEALGASRSGTSLSAFFQQFQVGQMVKQTFEYLQHAGVYDRSATWKGGRVRDAHEHLADRDLATSDPATWVTTTLKDRLLKSGALMQGAGGILAVSKAAGRQTGQAFLAELVVAASQFQKQIEAQRHAVPDPYQHMVDNDPEQKVAAFHAAENEMMVAVGKMATGPALEALKAMTGALNAFTDWSKANSNLASKLTLTALGMSVFSNAVGNLALGVFVGAPIVKGFVALASAVSPFGAGGAAGGALSALTAAGGVGSLAALGAAIVGLGGAVLSTLGVIKGFEALNNYLGLKPGKGNNGGPSPNGNYFFDGLEKWLHPPAAPPNPHPNARGLSGATRSPTAWFPTTSPYSGSGQPIVIHVMSVLDGKKVGSGIGRALMGPSTGTTGFDTRTGLSGGMNAAP